MSCMYMVIFSILLLVECSTGMYSDFTDIATQCVPCKKGSFGVDIGQSQCISCPPGYSTLNVGSTSEEDCLSKNKFNQIF